MKENVLKILNFINEEFNGKLRFNLKLIEGEGIYFKTNDEEFNDHYCKGNIVTFFIKNCIKPEVDREFKLHLKDIIPIIEKLTSLFCIGFKEYRMDFELYYSGVTIFLRRDDNTDLELECKDNNIKIIVFNDKEDQPEFRGIIQNNSDLLLIKRFFTEDEWYKISKALLNLLPESEEVLDPTITDYSMSERLLLAIREVNTRSEFGFPFLKTYLKFKEDKELIKNIDPTIRALYYMALQVTDVYEQLSIDIGTFRGSNYVVTPLTTKDFIKDLSDRNTYASDEEYKLYMEFCKLMKDVYQVDFLNLQPTPKRQKIEVNLSEIRNKYLSDKLETVSW